MTKTHCNTRNIKFYNLNKATLIKRNFKLNTRHVKVCFQDKSLRERKIMLQVYVNI